MVIEDNLKKVLITGGTGSVGRSLVEKFCKKGYLVTFQYKNNQKVADELCREFGAKSLKIDLAKKISLPENDYSVIINNAGIINSNVISHETSFGDWDLTLQVNLTAVFEILKICLPFMVNIQWGRVINISSIYGLRVIDNNLPYNVSKHALSGLTKSIAKEYAKFGITSNEICPGPIVSEIMTRVGKEESSYLGISLKEYFQKISDRIPCKRMAFPEDVANLASFLASTEANYLNGVSIPLDGGLIC